MPVDDEDVPLIWSDLIQLHALRTIASVLERRWRLGLGFAAPDGAVYPPRVSAECLKVQSDPRGDDACVAHATTTLRAHVADPKAPSVACVCHAGLFELSVPLFDGGKPLGILLAGGFRDGELAAADRITIEELLSVAAREILRYRTEQDGRGRRRVEATRPSYDAIIGRAPAMEALFRVLDKVVGSDSTVLVQGENGTGKELIAKAIHANSSRRDRRFLIQNCSAFNDNLLDSELFGHRRGAFTGAIADKIGLFEAADGGTFFLDEIGDMSPTLQVKVLRVLQEGTFTPLGDTTARRVDVRIIAATNRDLKAMVTSGEFREDLYYRVNVISLVVPPLRERREDIPVLIEHFMRKHARARRATRLLSPECHERMAGYPWPGNVRELENEVERLVVLAGDDKVIGEELLSPRIRRHAVEASSPATVKGLPGALASLERQMLEDALHRHRGNKTRAALELKISRRNLIRLAQKYALDEG